MRASTLACREATCVHLLAPLLAPSSLPSSRALVLRLLAGGFGVNFKGVNFKKQGRAAGVSQFNVGARERALDKEQKKYLKKLKKT